MLLQKQLNKQKIMNNRRIR